MNVYCFVIIVYYFLLNLLDWQKGVQNTYYKKYYKKCVYYLKLTLTG